ncbi:unnamed protein product [Laminaria digitata]
MGTGDVSGTGGPLMQLAHFRAGLLGVALVRASAYLVSPARSWLKALHDSVRDDRYLVGMRLQDHSDKTRNPGPGMGNSPAVG